MIRDLEKNESIRMLSEHYIGHLGYIAHGNPYVIPITYYYNNGDNHAIISYSGAGHKIDAMRNNQRIALEIDEIESLTHWKSVLVHGTFEELKGTDAKYLLHEFSEGVKKRIKHQEKKKPLFIDDFSSKITSEGVPVVYRINILDITGKERTS